MKLIHQHDTIVFLPLSLSLGHDANHHHDSNIGARMGFSWSTRSSSMEYGNGGKREQVKYSFRSREYLHFRWRRRFQPAIPQTIRFWNRAVKSRVFEKKSFSTEVPEGLGTINMSKSMLCNWRNGYKMRFPSNSRKRMCTSFGCNRSWHYKNEQYCSAA